MSKDLNKSKKCGDSMKRKEIFKRTVALVLVSAIVLSTAVLQLSWGFLGRSSVSMASESLQPVDWWLDVNVYVVGPDPNNASPTSILTAAVNATVFLVGFNYSGGEYMGGRCS